MLIGQDNKQRELSKDQIIINQKMQLDKFKAVNDKLQKKVEYYENFIENLNQFEKTQNLLNLKAFVSTNFKRFDSLVEELYKCKEDLEIEMLQHSELKTKFQIVSNQQLRDKEAVNGTVQPKAASNPEDVVRLTDQVKTLQGSITQLSKEVDDLTEKNQKYVKDLQKKDFFSEYEKLLKEIEGLRKQNYIVSEKLKAKMSQEN
jgi:uncharacterized protein YlxW (UPF0749 family)